MPTLNELVAQALEEAEENAAKIVEYASLMLSLRRRIRNALNLLSEGRTDEAKDMLVQALNDDGGFIRRRMEKIIENLDLEDECDDWPPAA